MEHGTISRYSNRRCRCDLCKKAASDYSRAYRARRKKEGGGEAALRAIDEKLEVRVGIWKQVYEAGRAGQVCDAIVRRRDPPVDLLAALFGGNVRLAQVAEAHGLLEKGAAARIAA